MTNKYEISKTIGSDLARILRKTYENITDGHNYDWTGAIQKSSMEFYKYNNELGMEWMKIFFECIKNNLKFDIKNSILYIIPESNGKANNCCLNNYTSGIWIYDLPPHRIRDLQGPAFIDFLDDNANIIKTMSYEEFKRIWLDDKKRKETIPANPKNRTNKHIDLIFT